jgi:hypothetical protein
MQNMPLPVKNSVVFLAVARWMCELPHSAHIGLEFIHGQLRSATLRIPYNTSLVGNPQSGVLHGGVVTSLIDTTSALAVQSLVEYRVAAAKQIGFTRATAYQASDDQPVAYGIGTFMVQASTEPLPGITAVEAGDGTI